MNNELSNQFDQSFNSNYSEEYNDSKLYNAVKTISDFTLSLMAIIVLSPLLLIISIVIMIESPGNPFYSQVRIGKNGRKFKIYKFRSMVVNADQMKKELLKQNEMSGPMFKMKRDPRVTKVGRFIRKTSIDELPQLFNVIKGEMSLVGPRPSLPYEVEQFEPWMLRRLNVKPGLTCYWQVSGRNDIDFENWMKLDIKYINDRSLWVDFKLILKTILVLFGDKHAS